MITFYFYFFQERVPAFQDLDDDGGPGFEYLEEPEFEDDDDDYMGSTCRSEQQEPPDEVQQELAGGGRGGGGDNQGMRNDNPLGSPSTNIRASFSPPPETITLVDNSPPPPQPPVTPRPKIVSARVQHDRLREEEERRRRRRAREEQEEEGCGGVADIEGDFDHGLRTGERGSGGLDPPRRKRGRGSSNQLGDHGEP